MRKYKHLFFDLDHTLWDFETNARLTLVELYGKYGLGNYFEGFEQFFASYEPVNEELWAQYREGEITRDFLNTERFYRPMKAAGADDYVMAQAFAEDFIAVSPQKTTLLPHAIEVLDYLYHRYQMHIITNGFLRTQVLKLQHSGLKNYFQHVFISEQIGASKPHKAFFEHAVKSVNARKRESLVIGDSLEADVAGARNFGLDQVYFNPSKALHHEKVTMEISSLKELMDFL
ncbi:MAG: YjjG family noncanonical pyrimidine nucleotidase [Breznakibacter sp.]